MSKNKKARSFPSILSVSGLDSKEYLRKPELLRDLVVHCPLCLLVSVVTRLACNGWYPRRIPQGLGWAPGRIYRKYCSRCRVAFSLLPDFVLPYQRYGLSLVASWLWAWLQGVRARCLDFYVQEGIPCPQPEERISWSDLLDQPGQRTRPGYQLLNRWAGLFSRRAARLFPGLVRVAIQEAVGLGRSLGRSVESWTAVPSRGLSLAHAWVHWEALWGWRSALGQVESRKAFQELVRYLAREPLPPSHTVRRASRGLVAYDSLVISGQQPLALPP